jgi:hypothetical protein
MKLLRDRAQEVLQIGAVGVKKPPRCCQNSKSCRLRGKHHLVERRGGHAVLDFLDVNVRKPGCSARVPQGLQEKQNVFILAKAHR